MGKIYNFDKIQILPFKKRIGNIAVTNFYMDGDVPKPIQSHLDIPPFSFFDIVKYTPNPYYGKEDEYQWEGDNASKFFGSAVGYITIHKSCFQHPETSYTLAYWENLDNDEIIPNLTFVGSRPFDLEESEHKIFWELAKIGQDHITKILTEFIEE